MIWMWNRKEESRCGARSLNANEDLMRGTNAEWALGAESDLGRQRKSPQILGLEADRVGQLAPYALP